VNEGIARRRSRAEWADHRDLGRSAFELDVGRVGRDHLVSGHCDHSLGITAAMQIVNLAPL